MTYRISSCLLGLLLLATVSAEPLGAGPDYAGLVEEGEELLAEGRARPALKKFRQAEEARTTEDPGAQMGIAAALLRLGQFRDAMEASRLAVPLASDKPDRIRVMSLLGTAISRMEDPGEDELRMGAAALKRAMQLQGAATPEMMLDYALVLARQGQMEAARDACHSVLEAVEGPAADRARILYCNLGAAMGFSPVETGPVPEDPPVVSSSPREETSGGAGGPLPQVLYRARPVYSMEAHEVGMEGIVGFDAYVNEEGCVVHSVPRKPRVEALIPAAQRALSQWVFRPLGDESGTRGSWVRVEFDFKGGTTQRDYEFHQLWLKSDESAATGQSIIR